MPKILIIILSVLCFFASCKKSLDGGKASAEFNGESWDPEVTAYTNVYDPNTFDLSMKMKTGRYEDQSFYVSRIPKVKGRYSFFELTGANMTANKMIGHYMVVEGGDVICDTYDPRDQDSVYNYVTVDEIDNGKVSGTFSANLYVNLPKCNPAALDSIILRNGAYEVRIRN